MKKWVRINCVRCGKDMGVIHNEVELLAFCTSCDNLDDTQGLKLVTNVVKEEKVGATIVGMKKTG